MFDAGQTARLQKAVDSMPDCYFAADMVQTTGVYVKSLTLSDPSWTSDALASSLADLTMVGQQLQDEGGDGPNPAHGGISGLYCKGSDGYTRFLRAYAGAYRAWDDVLQSKGQDTLLGATKKFLSDIGNGIKNAAEGAGDVGAGAISKALKSLWPVLALIAAVIVGIVIIAVVTKGKVSLKG